MPSGGSKKTNQEGTKLNGTHQLLAYANDNILGENIPYRKREALLDASKEVGLEVNPKKTKYMLLISCCKKAGQKHSIKIAKRSSENVATLTEENCMNEEITSRLKSGNGCYHSVQSPVFPPPVQECKG
jgi:hypothetical protein